jgi:hypothetical protein
VTHGVPATAASSIHSRRRLAWPRP